MNKSQLIAGWAGVIALLSAVIGANWATTTFGFVPVGLGFTATAGTFAAGVALASRDAIQDAFGKTAMFAVVAVGAVVSYWIADPMVALASAVAFALAELFTFLVYTPLRNRSKLGDRRWALAVVSASIVGSVVDTVVFLAIAFGWAAVLPALAGQMVGKAWATVIYLAIGKVVSWFYTSPTPAVR